MKQLITTLIFILGIQILAFSQSTLEERLDYADIVIEGKVISQTSFWNVENTAIFTSNQVEIYKTFKGNPKETTISIITLGGIVGNDFQFIPHSHQLSENTEGILFLKEKAEGNLELARVEKPKIPYSIRSRKFEAYDGAIEYTNPRDIYAAIENHQGSPFIKIASNSIEKSIQKWLNESLQLKTTATDILIEFTFENIELVGTDKVEFDIMTKSNQEGIRFAASDVYIAYSTEAFGTNAVANEKIEATKETVIENDVYTLQLADESEQIVKFLVNAGLEPNELYPLSFIAEKFLHVKLDVANIYELATISFEDFLMENESWFYDTETGEFVGFDKIAIGKPIFPFLLPHIETISPNPVPAGTRLDEHILTITGNDFGDHNNSDGTFDLSCSQCKVRFVDGDNSFGFVYARGTDILSWIDEEIRLRVPSSTAKANGKFHNPAASGKMRVESPDGNSNEKSIHIPYSVLNFQSNPDILTPARRFASSRQTENGIIFNYHANVIGGKKVQMDNAITKWCEETSVAWSVSDIILQDENIGSLVDGTDGRNIISIQPDGEFPNEMARAAVAISGHFTGCNSESVYIRDIDVLLKSDPFENDDAHRWYNYALHELGHALLLYHSSNPTGGDIDEYIMHYDITNINAAGSNNNGAVHYIHNVIGEGANTIFSSSANLLSSCAPVVVPIFQSANCSANNVKYFPRSISDLDIYPNPNIGQSLFLSIELEKSLNISLDILTLTGQALISTQQLYGSSGQNVFELANAVNIPQGTYFIRISVENTIFFTKFIRI